VRKKIKKRSASPQPSNKKSRVHRFCENLRRWEVEHLAAEFLRTGCLGAGARSDAVHLAVATLAEVDFLLTWNCRHLANAQILRRLEREARRLGWALPTVCTPLELMGDSAYEIESDT
jgi:hypothetical protein